MKPTDLLYKQQKGLWTRRTKTAEEELAILTWGTNFQEKYNFKTNKTFNHPKESAREVRQRARLESYN